MKINRIWLDGETCHEVGEDGVIKIEERIPSDIGLLWHYIIYFENGKMLKEFKFETVVFEKETEEIEK